jgi:cell division protein FtsB
MLSASAAEILARLRRQGLTLSLSALILLLQYPLWLGEGGWLKVREGAQKIAAQQALNQRLRLRNATLLAEVSDLKQGRESVEEKARSELGMVAPDEWFVRVIPAHTVGNE